MIQNFYFNWALLVSNPRGSLADLIAFLTKSNLYADFAEKWALGFQDPASPWMYAIIELHDRIMFYLIIILIVVLWFLVRATLNTNPMNFHHGEKLPIAKKLSWKGKINLKSWLL
jgi:hypothetical protein